MPMIGQPRGIVAHGVMSWIVLEAMNQDSWSSVCSGAPRPDTGCVIAKL